MRLINADALEKAILNKMKEVGNTPSGGDIEFMNYLDGRFSGMKAIFDLIEKAPDEHFPPAPQWISVDECLPEIKNVRRFKLGKKTYETSNSNCVLVRDNMESLGLGYYRPDGWYDVSDEIDPENITHWMEIPE